MKARALKARALKARALKARALKARALKPLTITHERQTMTIYPLKRHSPNGYRMEYRLVDYTDGTRKFRTFVDEEKATSEAKRIAGLIAKGQHVAANMRNGDAASYSRAIELLKPTGLSLEIAASHVAKAFEILGGDYLLEAAKFYARHRIDKVDRKLVAEVVKELIAAKTAKGKSHNYLRDLSARLNRFADDHAVEIHSINTADIQRWLDGLKVAPQTTKNFRTVLHTLFQFAESRGYVMKGGNPVGDTEQISVNGGDIEIYTPKEIVALLKCASKDFLPIVAIGGFAGLRTAEIQRLEWSEVDLVGGFITVGAEKSKTRSRRLVPITPNLASWLAPYAAKTGKIVKLTELKLRDARTETARKAKIVWKTNGLRHSFISYRMAATKNENQVASEAGNSPAMVHKHYRELVKPDDATAWFAIAPKLPKNVLNMQKQAAAK